MVTRLWKIHHFRIDAPEPEGRGISAPKCLVTLYAQTVYDTEKPNYTW